MIIVLQKLVHNGIFLHKGSYVNLYATLFFSPNNVDGRSIDKRLL